MSKDHSATQTVQLQWLTLVIAVLGTGISGWNAWVANGIQKQAQSYQEIGQALVALQNPAADDVSVKVKSWAKVVLEKRLADEQGKDEFQKWAELAGLHQGLFASLDKLCYRPHPDLLKKADAPPELPEPKDGFYSMAVIRAYIEVLESSHKNLALRHDALVDSLSRHCEATAKMAEKLKSLFSTLPGG